MEKAPTLKELLHHRKENYATSIVVSAKNDKDLFTQTSHVDFSYAP